MASVFQIIAGIGFQLAVGQDGFRKALETRIFDYNMVFFSVSRNAEIATVSLEQGDVIF